MPPNSEFRQFSMHCSCHSDIDVTRVDNFPDLEKAPDQGLTYLISEGKDSIVLMRKER
jgi:hypothetical protein